MFCSKNSFVLKICFSFFLLTSFSVFAAKDEGVDSGVKKVSVKKEEVSFFKKYVTIKNGLIGLGIGAGSYLLYVLGTTIIADSQKGILPQNRIADPSVVDPSISGIDPSVSSSLPSVSSHLSVENVNSKKIKMKKSGSSTIFSLNQKMTMAELIKPENEDLFFELCMKATTMAEKQFVLHFNNTAQGVEMKFSPAQKESDKNTHSASCSFCGKINKTEAKTDVVARKDKAIAFLSPGARSYPKCLIIPVTPIVRMSELQESHRDDVKGMAEIIREIIATYPEYKEFELEMHNGGAAAQTVHHLHWHFTVPGVNRLAQTAFTKMSGYEKAK